MSLFVASALFAIFALGSADNGDMCLVTQCQLQGRGLSSASEATSPGMLSKTFAGVAERGLCKEIDEDLACQEKCTESKIARQFTSVERKVKEKYCKDEQSEEPFVQSVKDFIGVLEEEYEKNECREANWATMNVDEICRKIKACAFEKSFNAVKGSYKTDVVEYVDGLAKAASVVVLDFLAEFSELPESCDFLFKPVNQA